MTIRRAEIQDIPGMTALLCQVGGIHHDIRPDIFRPNALKYNHQQLEALLQDEKKPIFVAVEGTVVAGYCFCQLREYTNGGTSTCRKEIYIDDLCVDENRRGQGIAAALYRHVTAWAKDLGCAFITLNVWCGNDGAMAFYEKMGLTPRHIMMEYKL